MPYKNYNDALLAYKQAKDNADISTVNKLGSFYPGINGDYINAYGTPMEKDLSAFGGFVKKAGSSAAQSARDLSDNVAQTLANSALTAGAAITNYTTGSYGPFNRGLVNMAGPTFTGFGDGQDTTVVIDPNTGQPPVPIAGVVRNPSTGVVNSTISRNSISTAVPKYASTSNTSYTPPTGATMSSQPFLDSVQKTENELETLLRDSLDENKKTYLQQYKEANDQATQLLSIDNPYTADINNAIGEVKLAYQNFDKTTQIYGDSLIEEYKKNMELVKSLEDFSRMGIVASTYEDGSPNMQDSTILQVAQNKRNFAVKMTDLSQKQAETMMKFEEAKLSKKKEFLGVMQTLKKDYDTNKKQVINEIMTARKQAREDNKLVVETLRKMATDADTRRKNSILVAKTIAPDIVASGGDQNLIMGYAMKLGIDPAILAGAVQSESYNQLVKDRNYNLAVREANDANNRAAQSLAARVAKGGSANEDVAAFTAAEIAGTE